MRNSNGDQANGAIKFARSDASPPGHFYFYESVPGGINVEWQTATGQWYHVAAVRESGVVTVYFNGVEAGTGASTKDLGTFAVDIGVTNSVSEIADGNICDARFYTSALTQSQISTLANGDNVTGAYGHWKLDDGPNSAINDGDPIREWTSIEGGYHSFVQSTTSKQPVFRTGANGFNNKPVIEFDGTDDLLVYPTNDISSSDRGTLFIVMATDFDGNQNYFSSADEATGVYTWIPVYSRSGVDDWGYWQRSNDTADSIMDPTLRTADEAAIFMVQSTGSAYILEYNGAAITESVTSGSNNGDWVGDTDNRDNFVIGALKFNSTEQAFADGKIAEIIMYDTVLTQAQIDAITRYLASRYGITLS